MRAFIERHAVGRWSLNFALIVVLLASGYYQHAQTSKAERALCALRADLEHRVDASKDFLIAHPNGIPGIPASVIKNGIANQEATIAALGDLNCD